VSEESGVTPDPSWSSFYRVCGVATVLLMVLFLFDVVAWMARGPYPPTAEGWFTLLRNDRPAALLLLSFPTLFGTILYFLTFLGLGFTLRPVGGAYATLAALFAFVGLSVLLVTYPAHSLVLLGDQYAAATTESRRVLLLAAGEARMATTAAGLNLGGFLVQGAAVMLSVLMLRSRTYGKTLAWLGIVGHGLDFVRIVMALAFLPESIGAILLMIGGLPELLWLALVGRRLYQLGCAGAPAL
jgi:hypothetical protein